MSLPELHLSEPLLAVADVSGGARIRGSKAAAIRAAGAELAEDGAPVLSFHGVVSCDELAARNGIAQVVSDAWYERGQVASVVGATPQVAAVIDRALRYAAIVAWADDGRLLGASKPLSQALDACRSLGRFSLSGFRRLVPVSDIAAENRLAMLVRLDAIVRTAGGWQAL